MGSRLTLDQVGDDPTHRDYRAEQTGPDIDKMLRELVRENMRESNRSPRDVALSLRMPVREVNAYIAGKPGTLDLLSRMCTAGSVSADQVLQAHPDWQREDGEPVDGVFSMHRMMLYRLQDKLDRDSVQLVHELIELMTESPQVVEALKHTLLGLRVVLETLNSEPTCPVEVPERTLRLLTNVVTKNSR